MIKLLIDAEDFGNRGFLAIVAGLTKCLRKYIPDVNIVVLSTDPKKYLGITKPYVQIQRNPLKWIRNEYGIKPMVRLWISYILHFMYCLIRRMMGKINHKIKSPYYDCDLIIHYVADWRTESDEDAWKTVPAFLWLLAMRILYDRPICTLPSSMGPFKNTFTRAIIKFVLNSINIVALREAISFQYVQELGLDRSQITLASDMAFLLDPASHEKVAAILSTEGINKNNKPIVGICPNKRNGRILGLNPTTGQLNYIELIARIADYIIEEFDASICFIPHNYDYDDINTCQQISELTKHKSLIKILKKEYSSDELKGIIGICDMFIGNWMHSTIAATSMGVPTLAIAFGDKFYRVIGETMGQERFIVDLRNQTCTALFTDMKSKIDTLWADREIVKRELEERTKAAQEQAWSYGRIISELIISNTQREG